MRGDGYQREDISCRNCSKEYNQTRNAPFLVCIRQHTVCQECLLSLKERQPFCPFCRQQIDFDRTCINQQVLSKVKTHSSSNQNAAYVPENTRVVSNQNNYPGFQEPPLQPYQEPPNDYPAPVQEPQGPIEGQVQNNDIQKIQQQQESSSSSNILLAIVVLLFLAGYIAIMVLSYQLKNSSPTSQCFSYNKTFLYGGTLVGFVQVVWNIYFGIIVVIVCLGFCWGAATQHNSAASCNCSDSVALVIFLGVVLFFVLKALWLIIQGIAFLSGSEMQYCPSSLGALLVLLIIDNLLEYWMWFLITRQM